MEHVKLATRQCIKCGKPGMVIVSAEGYRKYSAGAHVQTAFPNLHKDLREQIITGTHPACWDAMFGSSEDE